VTVPDGLIACLFRPVNGNCHKAFMLCMSQLQIQLQELMPLDNGIMYATYGDPVYPSNPYIWAGHHNAAPRSVKAFENTVMSASQICVEWSFRDITLHFKWLNFDQSLCILQFLIGQYYTITAFLVNLCSILYGNQTSLYFGAEYYWWIFGTGWWLVSMYKIRNNFSSEVTWYI